MRDNIGDEYVTHTMTSSNIKSFLINFHIFHIFSLPYLFKILYSWDSILMCMTN